MSYLLEDVVKSVTTPPAVVSLAEAKQYIKVNTSSAPEESLITAQLAAIYDFIENYCSISLGTYIMTVYLTGEEIDYFLEYGPVKITPAIAVKNEAGDSITFSKFGVDFPRLTFNGSTTEAYNITYTTEPYKKLEAIKEAILIILMSYYEREISTNILIEPIVPKRALALLSPHRQKAFV